MEEYGYKLWRWHSFSMILMINSYNDEWYMIVSYAKRVNISHNTTSIAYFVVFILFICLVCVMCGFCHVRVDFDGKVAAAIQCRHQCGKYCRQDAPHDGCGIRARRSYHSFCEE